MSECLIPWQLVPSSSAVKREANRAAAQRYRNKRKIEGEERASMESARRFQELSQDRAHLVSEIDRLEQERAYLHAMCQYYRYQRDIYISTWNERLGIPLPEVPHQILETLGVRNHMVIQRYEQEPDTLQDSRR